MRPRYKSTFSTFSIGKGDTISLDGADVLVILGKSSLDDSFEVQENGLWRLVDSRESVVITSGSNVSVRATNSPMVVSVERKVLDYVAGTEGEKLPLVSFARNPDGVNRTSVGGIANLPGLQSARPGNVLTKSFLGKFASKSNGADHTTHIQTVLESDFDAIRLLIPNGIASSITGVIAKTSIGGTLGTVGASSAIAPGDSDWRTVTFSGASSVTLPSGTSVDAPSWTASDWIQNVSVPRADGGSLPILHVRLCVPAANPNRTAYAYAGITNWGDESIVAGRVWRPRTQAVNGVTTLGNMTIGGSAVDYECYPVVIQYLSRRRGVTVMIVGDSIYECAGATNRHGWQYIGQHAVSTPHTPVEVATISIGGSNAATWATRLSGAISLIQPDFVVMPAFEVNDTDAAITLANMRAMRVGIARARAACREANAQVILATGIPANPTGTFPKPWGATDSFRRDLNDEYRAMGEPLLDFDAVVRASTTDANGQILFADGMTDDALHPSAMGHAAMASQQFAPMLRQIIAQNF